MSTQSHETIADHDADRVAHFVTLTRTEQERAIRELASSGFTDHMLAKATGLAVEQIRRVLGGERKEKAP